MSVRMTTIRLLKCPQCVWGRGYVRFIGHDSGPCPELDVCDWRGGLPFRPSDHGLPII